MTWWSRTGKQERNLSTKKVLRPQHWSDTAINIACSRWFRGKLVHPNEKCQPIKCSSVSHLPSAILVWRQDISHRRIWTLDRLPRRHPTRSTCSVQYARLFERRMDGQPRTSACFLIPVEDNLWIAYKACPVEARVFQHGGGAGVYVGNVSHEGRALSKGGYASGLYHSMRVGTALSGAIKVAEIDALHGTLRWTSDIQIATVAKNTSIVFLFQHSILILSVRNKSSSRSERPRVPWTWCRNEQHRWLHASCTER